MKSYTDLEQSRKLAEIIPIESADACWTNHKFSNILSSWRVESSSPAEYKSLLDYYYVQGYLIEPAWSLAALLGILSKQMYFLDEDGRISLSSYKGNRWNITSINAIDKEPLEADDPLDAAFEMVCWLKENGHI